jgi:putative redox protein
LELKKEFTASAQTHTTSAKYQAVTSSGSHTITSDEPETIGGCGTSPTPHDLLLASLGSCTAITLKMYIERKGWQIDDITVDMELFRADAGTIIEIKLSFNGKLSEDQNKRLVQIANLCPIHKLMAGNIFIDTATK